MTIDLRHLPADVLGLSDFARRVLHGRGPVLGIEVPARLSQIQRPADRFDADERALLVSRIEEGLASLTPHVAVFDSVRALREPSSSIVLATGRPALLGGSLSTIYAGLHAIALARALENEWSSRVVPVLWIDADDADLTRGRNAWLLNRNFDVQRLGLANMSETTMPPSRIVLHDSEQRLPSVREFLKQLLRGSRHLESALSTWMPIAGESFARSTTRSLLECLGPHGLIVVEPDWMRDDHAHYLARIVGSDPAEALHAGVSELQREEIVPAFDPDEVELVTHVEERGSQPLRLGGDGFAYDNEPGSRTASELAAEIVQAPSSFVAAPELLSLVQNFTLPVAARVIRREELAREAQLAPLARTLDAPRPALVPQLSCSIVEKGTLGSLEKLGLEVRDALEARGKLEPPALAVDPHPTLSELREFSKTARASFREIAAPLLELDRTLRPVAKRSSAELAEAIERLCQKAERVAANRGGKLGRHARRLNSSLYPMGSRQEDLFGPFAFCARHGDDWIRELLHSIDPVGCEHVVVHLE